MKIAGCIIVILMTGLIGYDMSRQLNKRAKQLREIIHSLQIMEAEMEYGLLPLEEVFQKVGDKTPSPVSDFYTELAEQLSAGIENFDSGWDLGLQGLKEISALKQEEMETLKQFGRNLGHHNIHQQEKHIKLTIHHLEHILSVANDEKNKYEKTMKTLGILIGIFIVLIIF